MIVQPLPSRNGFTLVEMLMALLIFAIIAGGAVMLLRFSVDAEMASRNRIAAMSELRRFNAVWQSDLGQAIPRPARDRDGAIRPALDTDKAAANPPLLRLTRSGWTNHDGTARPSIQKFEYRLTGGRLERAGYAMVDGAEADPPSLLLDKVTAAKLRFRDRDGLWRDDWRPEKIAEMPVAIELQITRAGEKPLTLITPVGANY